MTARLRAVTAVGNSSKLERLQQQCRCCPLLPRLPEREQRIVALRFYGNLIQSQIATEVGLSQMHVSRLLARALQFLRSRLTTLS